VAVHLPDVNFHGNLTGANVVLQVMNGVGYLTRNLLIGIILAMATAAPAQDVSPSVPVRAVWNVSALPVSGKAELGVVFYVPPKHHITDVDFGLFFVQIADTLGMQFDKPIFPPGERFGEERAYRGRTLVRMPVTVTDSAQPGNYTLPMGVGYQICQEFGQEVCFLPVERTVEFAAIVVPRGTTVVAANANIFAPMPEVAATISLEDRLIAALEKGSWLAFVLVFLGGVLTSFTPCVYPVIPITIGYIGGASRGSPWRGLRLSALFALGIAIVYSSLGLLAAATGALFGVVSGSPVVSVIVAVIFAVMGFSMLGAFDIALPSALQTSLSGGAARRGFFGPLLLGMASGLVMAPCVGPLIVALLAWVSKTGSLIYGWALLFVFSLGLGLLFLVIGTFAGALQALPRAGAWMDVIKKAFGWILLSAALYLLRYVIPQPYFTLAWVVLLIVFSVFAGAFDMLTPETGAARRLWKAAALIPLVLGVILLFRVFGPSGKMTTAPAGSVEWIINDEEKALAEAESGGKPMIVDVYADWCAACVELDHRTYNRPEVVSRLDGLVRLKLDFTRETEWVKEMKRKYRITGMPTVIFYDPAGEEITRFAGFKSERDFIALLDRHGL
jgi:thiol:disulfide interchange protein DsbD